MSLGRANQDLKLCAGGQPLEVTPRGRHQKKQLYKNLKKNLITGLIFYLKVSLDRVY